MTRTYALKRLLEHGPLTLAQIEEMTGWSYIACRKAIEALRNSGTVKTLGRVSGGGALYGL